jgi:hypothetical protein
MCSWSGKCGAGGGSGDAFGKGALISSPILVDKGYTHLIPIRQRLVSRRGTSTIPASEGRWGWAPPKGPQEYIPQNACFADAEKPSLCRSGGAVPVIEGTRRV